MMLTDLADVLRAAGLTVVEQGGWKSRSNDGNRFAGVQGILCHWTGTALSAPGSYPSLNIVTFGRSDLPGMLSQLGLGRDGVWYVIGAGVAWHAGEVDQSYSDNYHAIGIEAEYHPDQGAWPDVQQRSYERGCKALANHYSVPIDRIRGHYEAAIPYGRKPDPRTLPGGMPGFRQRTAAMNLEEDDDMAYSEADIEKMVYRAMTNWWNDLSNGMSVPLYNNYRRVMNDHVVSPIRSTIAPLADDEANIVAAVQAMPTGGQVDVEDLANRLRGTLGDALADELAQRLTG